MKTTLLLGLTAATMFAQNPVTDAVTASYSRVKLNLIESAEAMPEEGYSFQLTPAQRPFGEWVEHTAMGNYTFCAGIQGIAPDMKKIQHGLTKKADLQQALVDSFAYCDAALKSTDDRKASTEVAIGERKLYPVTAMVGLVGSLNEHYGNMVGYLRSKGITPPSSARTAKKK